MESLIADMRQQFTTAGFLVNIAFAVMLSALVKVSLRVFGVVPHKARLYWISVPLLFLCFLFSVQIMTSDPPKLKGHIEQINMAAVSRDGKPLQRTLVGLIISVYNTGSPSVIDNFTLRIKPPGQTEIFVPRPTEISGDSVLLPSHLSWRPAIVLYEIDSLYHKASEVPIAKGGVARGVLVFFANREPHELRKEGTRLKFGFDDVAGIKYEVEATWDNTGEERPVRLSGIKSGPFLSNLPKEK